MSYHAKLSPSSHHRWGVCYGSVVLSEGKGDGSSEAADEGTAKHELGARCLTENRHPSEFIGTSITAGDRVFAVDADFASDVNVYVQRVREYADGNMLQVEVRVPIDHMTGEEGATGQSDAVIFVEKDKEVQIHDAKFGYDKVYAKENAQLLDYASGTVRELELLYDIERVRLVIHQPAINWFDEWDCSIEYLREHEAKTCKQAAMVKIATESVVTWYGPRAIGEAGAELYLKPGDKQCKYCPAFPCAAASKFVEATIGADFDVIAEAAKNESPYTPYMPADLSTAKKAIPLIRAWCQAIDNAVYANLNSGVEVSGFKLVEGSLSDRTWEEPAQAEAAMKAQGVKEEMIYTKKLISYPQAEKLFKVKSTKKDPKPQSKVWLALEPLMAERKPGAPSVAPIDDPRPAYVPDAVADDFDVITEEEELLA